MSCCDFENLEKVIANNEEKVKSYAKQLRIGRTRSLSAEGLIMRSAKRASLSSRRSRISTQKRWQLVS